MKAAVAEIFEQLPNLSPEQLKELTTRASFLLNPRGQGEEASDERDLDLEMVGKEFTTVLEEEGRRNIILPILLKTRAGKPFRNGVKLLLQFVRQDFKCLKRVDQVKLTRHLLRLMVRDLSNLGRGLSPLSLAQQMVAVANVVDRNYPGYRESGMLPIVLKRLALGPSVSSKED